MLSGMIVAALLMNDIEKNWYSLIFKKKRGVASGIFSFYNPNN